LMMSLWDALRMNMMISYQELVRTFLSVFVCLVPAADMFNNRKHSAWLVDLQSGLGFEKL
uniref:hypothetical protein n=1 Tax=Escherichia coli TaxID=562 RepID=UPI001BECAF73